MNVCKHTFCYDCIERWRQRCIRERKPFACPYCRTESPGYYQNLQIQERVDGLLFVCDWIGNGCQEFSTYRELEHHQENCPYHDNNIHACQNCRADLRLHGGPQDHNCFAYLKGLISLQEVFV